MRRVWLAFVLFGLGCQSFPDRPAARAPAEVISPQSPAPPQAQATERAPSTQTLKDMEKNACQQSAALVAQKQEAAACALLREFLTKYPERCAARQAYGDLLLQMRQVPEARLQFEEQLEHCQDDRPDRFELMLYAHSQLAEIASGTRDTYAERLHRGIGYYLMAHQFKGVGIGGTTISRKSLLENAQSELTQAIEIRPDDAKPCWYLSGVYREQGQIASADRFVRQAGQLASQSRLTQQERRGIELAVRSLRSN